MNATLAGLLPFVLLALGSCGGGGGGGTGPLVPDPLASTLQVTPAFGTPADGITTVAIELRLVNGSGAPIPGALVELEVSGQGNRHAPMPLTDANGVTRSELASSAGETKTLVARTQSGGRPTELGPRTVDFLLIPPGAHFVRVSGSDADTGRSPRSAWRTLARAFEVAGPGIVVHVGGGVHAAPPALTLAAAADEPFWLRGDPSGAWTGDAGPVVLDAEGGLCALRLAGARHVVLQELTLRGGLCALALEDVLDVRVLGCRLFASDIGLLAAGVEDLIVQDCAFSANRQEGLRLVDARRTRLENNLFYDNGGPGLWLRDAGQDTDVRFNTFYRNGGAQLQASGAGGGSIVENILAEGAGDALLLPAGHTFGLRDNLVWSNALQSLPGEPDDFVVADPRFMDPAGADRLLGGEGAEDDDFRLRPESPANDLGRQAARDVVLGSRQSLATRTTRGDDLFESSGVDRPSTNAGFHTRLPEGLHRSLAPGGARFAHALPGDVRVHSGAWERARPAGLEHGRGPTLEAEVLYLEQRVSPLDGPEELLAVQCDTGTRGRVLVRHWDGRRWSEAALAPFLDDVPSSELADRRFDLEYEARSGRALFVLSELDGRASYRVLAQGRWSAPQPVPTTGAEAERLRWIELVARPGTDELALVTLDAGGQLHASMWSGSSWGVPVLLESTTVARPGWRPFDVAFESLSGDVLVMWSFDLQSEEARFATLERASGQWRTGQHPSIDAIGLQLVLCPDPASDRIVAALGEADLGPDVAVTVWDGAAFRDTAELTLAAPLGSRLLELAWLGESGVALVLYRRAGLQPGFSQALLLPDGWRLQPDVVLAGVGPARRVRLQRVEGGEELLGLLEDQAGRLFALHHDGQRFTLLDEGRAVASGLGGEAGGRAFDLAVRAPN